MNTRVSLSRPAIYEFCVQGCLDKQWDSWFAGLTLTRDPVQQTTTMTGPVGDQAALHGVLARIRDLGLPLLSARWIDVSEGD